MTKIMNLAKHIIADENGAALIEYTILLGIMLTTVIATIGTVGTWIVGQWTTFNGALP